MWGRGEGERGRGLHCSVLPSWGKGRGGEAGEREGSCNDPLREQLVQHLHTCSGGIYMAHNATMSVKFARTKHLQCSNTRYVYYIYSHQWLYKHHTVLVHCTCTCMSSITCIHHWIKEKQRQVYMNISNCMITTHSACTWIYTSKQKILTSR